MRFDLTDLRLFLLILDSGSITGGAERANLSLPSASARVRGMEAALGVPLFERSRRGVSSTPAGDTLAHHARLVLGQIDRMQSELDEHAAERQTHIRVWANTAALTEFLPASLAPFLRDHAHVHIDLRERPSTETVKAVLAGTADIGIISNAVDHGILETFPYALDQLVLVSARDDVLRSQRQIALRDVIDRAFIGLSEGSALQAHLQEHAVLAGQGLHYRTRVRTFDAICAMVEHGAGVGIVPATAAKRHRGTHGIHTLTLTDPWARRELRLCMRERGALRPAERQLVDALITSPGRSRQLGGARQ